jgi:opacity protein-like surface antigen
VHIFAQEQTFDFSLTPYGAYRVGGEFEERGGAASIDLDEGGSYGIIFNARHSPITQWEILYSRQETNAEASGLGLSDPTPELTVEYLHAGGTYLWDGDKVRPFLAATLGGTRVDISTPGLDDDTFWSFSLGLGLQMSPSNRLGLRLEARGFGTLLDSDSDLFCQISPSNNTCIVRIDGTIMWQVEALAGIVFRF